MKKLAFLIKDSEPEEIETIRHWEKKISIEVSNKADESIDIDVFIGYKVSIFGERDETGNNFDYFRYKEDKFENSEFIDAAGNLLDAVGVDLDKKFPDFEDEINETLDNLDEAIIEAMEEEGISR